MASLSLMVDVIPTECGRRICTVAGLEARNRHIDKCLERINERTLLRAP
jgi:hypothetical protein